MFLFTYRRLKVEFGVQVEFDSILYTEIQRVCGI